MVCTIVPAVNQGQFHSQGFPRTRPDLSLNKSREYSGKVPTEIPMASRNAEPPPNEEIGSRIPRSGAAYKICHLKHPELNEYLRGHQQVTFRLVKSGKKTFRIP